MRCFLYIAFVLAVASCSSNKEQVAVVPVPSVAAETVAISESGMTDTVIFYSRGACFGMCPIFDLTIMKDGRAIYNGKNHVDRIGRYQATVNHTDVEKVLRKANEIGYFQLKAEYDNLSVHDLPDITTGIASNGRLHTVRNRYKGPAALRMVYAELDTLIEKQSWKPAGSGNQE